MKQVIIAFVFVSFASAMALLVHLLYAHCKDRAESARDAEYFKEAALEAESRARQDRNAVEDWLQKP